jgi:hypothetical protein
MPVFINSVPADIDVRNHLEVASIVPYLGFFFHKYRGRAEGKERL